MSDGDEGSALPDHTDVLLKMKISFGSNRNFRSETLILQKQQEVLRSQNYFSRITCFSQQSKYLKRNGVKLNNSSFGMDVVGGGCWRSSCHKLFSEIVLLHRCPRATCGILLNTGGSCTASGCNHSCTWTARAVHVFCKGREASL